MTGSTAEGTYTLVLELAESATVEVGALGAREFESGRCAYSGSAFGPGWFVRVERHRELCSGERVPGFGASDCDCESRLVYQADGESLRRAVEHTARVVNLSVAPSK